MRLLAILVTLLCFNNCWADVKAVLFDCDGTLVDSEYAHFLGWNHGLEKYGYSLPLEDYHLYVGKSSAAIASLLAQKVGEDCADFLINTKRVFYKKLCASGLPAITPTVEFLKALAAEKEARDIKIGLCSAAKREEILAHLRHLEIEQLFNVILSGQEDLHEYSDPEGVNKPKPYIYLHAMKMLGTAPHNTVVIEDSGPGATAGVRAGCFTIAIPNAYTKHHDFSSTNLRMDSLETMDVDRFLTTVQSTQNTQALTLQVGVKVLLKNKEGKFLLLKRNPTKYSGMSQLWDIPGGRIQKGTGLLENLKREVGEETGLSIIGAPTILGAQDIFWQDKHTVRITYTGMVEGEPTLSDEHTDYAWFTLEQMLNLDGMDVYLLKLLS